MPDENIIRLLRMQAWQRAKAELTAVSCSFFGEDSARPGQFEAFSKALEDFISTVEDKGLEE